MVIIFLSSIELKAQSETRVLSSVRKKKRKLNVFQLFWYRGVAIQALARTTLHNLLIVFNFAGL